MWPILFRNQHGQKVEKDIFVAPALGGQFRHAVIHLFVCSSTINSGCLVRATSPSGFGQSF